jgi:hypothetical protein
LGAIGVFVDGGGCAVASDGSRSADITRTKKQISRAIARSMRTCRGWITI